MGSVPPLGDLINVIERGNMLMESANKGMETYRFLVFLGSFWYVIVFILILLFLYFRYLHTKRFRFFNTAIMIKLEPENMQYCEKIGLFFTNYKLNLMDRLDYGSKITNNLYFFDSKMPAFVKIMQQIENEVFQVKEFSLKTIDKNNQDVYTDNIAKLVNSNFSWSKSEKFKITKSNSRTIKKFFNLFESLSKKNFQETFNAFIQEESIFNYIDIDSLLDDSIDDLLDNKLIRKYAKHMSAPLLDTINEINTLYTNEKVVTLFKEQSSNPLLVDVVAMPVEDLFDELVRLVKNVLFEFYGITEKYYIEHSIENGIVKKIVEEEKTDCSSNMNDEKDFGDQLTEFVNSMAFLKRIEVMKEFYKKKQNLEKFGNEYYLLIERLVYTTFSSKTTRNVFSPNKANQIITIYENIVDYINFELHKETIELAIQFTIHHALNTDTNKTVHLQNAVSLYVSFNELFVMHNTYKEVLEDYNIKRQPKMKELKGLYNDSLENILDYFILDGVVKQWEYYLLKSQPPPRYSWILDGFVRSVASKTPNKILDMVMGSEGFVEHFEPEKEAVTENFVGAIRSIGKALKSVPGFIKKLMSLLKIVLNPFTVIVGVAKFFLVLFLIILKLFLFTIKPGGMYIIGEYLLYFVVLVITTMLNAGRFVILYGITFLLKQIDVNLTNGFFYKFIYWLLGATENSPSAWYKHAGYHYGHDMCVSEGGKNDNRCNNYYQNKAKRMFLAYHRCGDNYKPDRMTKGFMCERKYEQEPGFCIQSNIYRLTNDMSVKTPIFPGSFVPTPKYIQSTEKQRSNIQNKFSKMKYNFYNNCGSTMKEYDPLTKNICRLYPGIMNSNKDMMASLCYNAYCKNGTREPFCYKMTSDYNFKNNNKSNNVVTRMFVVFVYVLILAFLINIFLQTANPL
uniref:Uncharacterized protein n=1 Tax=Pyramimonas orientalis virus TaxID=455367 RepID=A0A7M3UNU0_POV01|nr:hypothetical protein HWQ62_00238 [Pyramimonas orientalis virus]